MEELLSCIVVNGLTRVNQGEGGGSDHRLFQRLLRIFLCAMEVFDGESGVAKRSSHQLGEKALMTIGEGDRRDIFVIEREIVLSDFIDLNEH